MGRPIGNCCFCGEPIETTPYVEVKGFEQKRDQGGTNAIRLRERTGRIACGACVTARAMGYSDAQRSLL